MRLLNAYLHGRNTGNESGILIQLIAFEPALPRDRGLGLADLAMELAVEAAAFKASLRPELVQELGRLVRSMNCYYSNLIEGHHTHPVEIERALSGNYDRAPEKRNLQLEARAHIEVQAQIDLGHAPSPVVSEDFLQWTHREFCQRLPDELLTMPTHTKDACRRVVPGEYRTDNVEVGRHLAPSPDDVGALMRQFTRVYARSAFAATDLIVGVAAAHHRLLWIHPFLDGNGRVARLFSHAMLRECGIGCELWSISRGLARNVAKYKASLAAADEMRRGDLDGRGNLSELALGDFCKLFLEICLDQVRFMRDLMNPTLLVNRITVWADEETAAGRLPRGAKDLLRHAATEGAFGRGAVPKIIGYQERQSRTILNKLLERGYLTSDGPRGLVRLTFPLETAERWLPLLYPASLHQA